MYTEIINNSDFLLLLNSLFAGSCFENQTHQRHAEHAGDETLAFKENQDSFWRYSVMGCCAFDGFQWSLIVFDGF
jgi:hypothetical protein